MPRNPDNRPFPTTRWSLIVQAQQTDLPTRKRALGELFEEYWPPVYSYIRANGRSPHDAEDLTQGFFAMLYKQKVLDKVDPSRGRLRSYLLVAVKNFVATEWRKTSQQKRGGGKTLLSLDLEHAESLINLPGPYEATTPEDIYQQQWVVTLLKTVLSQLGKRYAENGKQKLFEALKPGLTPGVPMATYPEISQKLGMNEQALRVAAHRLKKRYGDLLRTAVTDTLASGEDLDEELQFLMSVFD